MPTSYAVALIAPDGTVHRGLFHAEIAADILGHPGEAMPEAVEELMAQGWLYVSGRTGRVRVRSAREPTPQQQAAVEEMKSPG